MNNNTLGAIVTFAIASVIIVATISMMLAGGSWEKRRGMIHSCIDAGANPKICVDAVMK